MVKHSSRFLGDIFKHTKRQDNALITWILVKLYKVMWFIMGGIIFLQMKVALITLTTFAWISKTVKFLHASYCEVNTSLLAERKGNWGNPL